jgi:hypothetical protein
MLLVTTGAWEAMLKYSVAEKLHTMRVPTLMVAGAADNLLHFNLRYARTCHALRVG